jgi:hypothetical protein
LSYLNLRDWAVKDRITAASLQDMTDRHNAYTPLTFSGNVKVRGGMLHGLHVHVPDQTVFVPPGLFVLKITGNRTRGGMYEAHRMKRPTSAIVTTSGSLDLEDFSEEDTAGDLTAINMLENGIDTHRLSHSDNLYQLYCLGLPWGTDDGGREAFLIVHFWTKGCTAPTP